jgi:hypothetical protein
MAWTEMVDGKPAFCCKVLFGYTDGISIRLQLAKWCSKADQTKHAAHLKPISMPSRSAVLARNFRVKPATRVKPNGGPVRTLFLIINTLAASAALATPRGERGPLCAADNRCEINPHCPEATMLIVAKS